MQQLYVLITTLFGLFVYSFHQFPLARALTNSTANNGSVLVYSNVSLGGNSSGRIFLQSRSSETLVSFGLYSTDGSLFILCIMMTYYNGYADLFIGQPQVIWSANRHFPVGRDAILSIHGAGELLLHNTDGTLVWSTPTQGTSVVGMRLDGSGNLVLFHQNNSSVWQSFDYPTDTLVMGQSLCVGVNLTANVSLTSWTSGQISLHTLLNGLQFYFRSAAYTQVFQATFLGNGTRNCFVFSNGILGFPNQIFSLPLARSLQFMRLEFDGHLRLYEMKDATFRVVFDVSNDVKFCDYPLACGEYSVCVNGQCCCPSSSYFRFQDEWRPDIGCIPLSNLSCNHMHYHQLVPVGRVSYFSDDGFQTLATNASDDVCKQSCLEECSCKVALFRYDSRDGNTGSCLLLSQALQLSQTKSSAYHTLAFFKIQGSLSVKRRINIAVGSAAGSFALLSIATSIVIWRKCKKREEEEYFGGIAGVPAWFSYDELKIATRNFSTRLGAGGFGSVFKGKIGKETIAVKRLEGVDQGKDEFLAEVETIGRIHHINLVRLIGFCAEKSHRLLVYEYMSNGSLDKWIFHAHPVFTLSWKTRRNIIMGIAKGLSYLHEECERRIAHLDIKPQNILLDDRFNAKVSDFGQG